MMSDSNNPIFSDERKVRYLEWLVTIPEERNPKTSSALAEQLGVSPRTLRDWKSKQDFLRAWEKRAHEVAGDPERTQRVLDSMYDAAVDPTAKDRVSAAKTWLEATGAIKPPQQAEKIETRLDQLSNEQLQALIAEKAQAALDERAEAQTPKLSVVK